MVIPDMPLVPQTSLALFGGSITAARLVSFRKCVFAALRGIADTPRQAGNL